jgi:AcrR family transcriptional regulator
MPPARTRARRGDGELLREEILATTERLLIETGSEEAVSIRAVAEATGVTPPSIYRHFTDKTHLLFEVCDRQFRLLHHALEEACAGIDDPVEGMRARGNAYVRFGMEHPEHYRIMFMGPSYGTPEQWEDVLATGAFANLLDGLQAVIDAGLARPGADLFTMGMHVWASIHGLTSLLVAKPTLPWPDLDGFIDQHLDLALQPHLA